MKNNPINRHFINRERLRRQRQEDFKDKVENENTTKTYPTTFADLSKSVITVLDNIQRPKLNYDIIETPAVYQLIIEVPGVRKENINIDVNNQRLHLYIDKKHCLHPEAIFIENYIKDCKIEKSISLENVYIEILLLSLKTAF